MLVVLGGLAAMIISAMYRGWALMLLWRWFVVSTFGLPELRVPAALGIAVLVMMLTLHHVEKSERSFGGSVLHGFIVTTVGLAAGWVYSLFL